MSETVIQLLIGSALIALATVMFLRPQIVDWLDEQTNARVAKKQAERGASGAMEVRLRIRRRLRLVIPGVLLIVGLGAIVSVFT